MFVNKYVPYSIAIFTVLEVYQLKIKDKDKSISACVKLITFIVGSVSK